MTKNNYWVWYYTRLNNGEWLHVRACNEDQARLTAASKIFGLLEITHVTDIDPATHNGEIG